MKRAVAIFLAVAVLQLSVTVYAKAPENSAVSAILIEAQSGKVLYSDNANEKRAMASITKIMTTLLTIESGNLDEAFVVDSEAIEVEGTSMGLKKGDIVTKRALCYGMMLPSGNDAANASAVKVSGSIDSFVELMNKRAKEIGMNDTHFVTPSGLDAEGHYTTAFDMALLTREALENELFAEICKQETATLEYGNPVYTRTLTNTNKMLSMYDGAIGVKTGFTDNARRTLVSAATRNGVTLICVTLADSNDWEDHCNLLDYGFTKVIKTEVQTDVSGISLEVVGGVKDAACVFLPNSATLTQIDGQIEQYETKINVPKFLYAPIEIGDVVGEISYILNGEQICTVPLVANENIERTEIEKNIIGKIIEYIKNIF